MDGLEKKATILVTAISVVFLFLAIQVDNTAWALYALLTPISYYLILRIGKLVLDLFSVSVVLVATVLNLMGGVFGFYAVLYYDVLVHVTASFALAYLIFFKINQLSFIRKKSKHLFFLGFITIATVAFLGYINELLEFLVDFAYFDRWKETLGNSLFDQIVNLSSAVLGTYTAYLKYTKKIKFL